jgi:ATP-dependent 26S proteasome regulatory subunit
MGVNYLLYGPPGTGKTQLADVLATEAVGNIFIQAPSSAFFSKYVGQSEKNLIYKKRLFPG